MAWLKPKGSPLYICRYVTYVRMFRMYDDMQPNTAPPLSLASWGGGGRDRFFLPVVDLRVEVTVEDVIEGKQSSSWE